MHRARFALLALLVAGCAAELAERDPRMDPASARAEEAPPPPPITLNQKDPLLSVAPTNEERTPPTYACPMHSEVGSNSPGRCVRCGMPLVPREKQR